MTGYSWSAGTSGNWSDAANWTPSGIPGAGDTAIVSAAGSYAIQLDVPAIGTLILDAPGATIDPTGPLALAGVLDARAGTFTVSDTITGGTIRPDGGTITYAGGTLDGVTLDGPLDLSAEGAFVTITDGIAFTGPAPEQILLTGYDSELDFGDAETLNNAAITMFTTSYLGTGAGLTFGASSTLTIDGGYTAPRSAFFGAVIAGNLLDNRGAVAVSVPLDDIATTTINEGSFVVDGGGEINSIYGVLDNSGVLELSGENVELTVNGTLANSGSVSLASGATLILDGGVANTGTITVGSGDTLYVNGSETFDQLGTIDRNGGTIDIGEFGHSGQFDLSGRTLDVTAGGEFDGVQFAEGVSGGTIKLDGGAITFFDALGSGTVVDLNVSETYDQLGANGYLLGATVEIGSDATLDLSGRTLNVTADDPFAYFNGLILAGTVAGGTIELDGGAVTYAGGTFDGVTLDGPLDLGAAGAAVSIEHGIAFSGPAPERILVTGTGASLTLDDNETLDHVAIVLGGVSAAGLLTTDGTLTLGPNSTVAVAAGGAVLAGTSLDNAGTITAAGFLSDQAQGTTNTGSIALGDGSGDRNVIFDLTSSGTLALSGTGTELLVTGSLASSGSITIGNSDSLNAYGSLDNTGMITVSSGGTLDLATSESLDQLGSITRDPGGVLDLDGTLDLSGHTLDVTPGSLFDGVELTGTIAGGTIALLGGGIGYDGGILRGVTLDGPLDLDAVQSDVVIENGITFAGSAPGQILVTGTDATLLFNDTETLDHVAITLGNAALYIGTGLTLGPDATLALIGTVGGDISGVGLDNQGTITAAIGSLDDQALSTTNAGTIAIGDGLGNNQAHDLLNDGTLAVSGSGTILTLTGGLDNAGSVTLGGGAVLELTDPTTTLGAITFLDRTGTLQLDAIGGDTDGTLAGFAAGDLVTLDGTGYSLAHSANTLSVSQDGSVVDTFTLAGQDYTDAGFTLTATGAGRTDLSTDAPCFCAGTLILTDRGERPVELLQAGDLVVTRQDGIDTAMPVRWIGRRRLHVARHPEPEQVSPIRILRGAVAPGIPCRDLRVSPDHAVFLDGMLIQARQLVNGMTIRRDTACAVVTYHHVELDRHAILVADGLPCESYLDTGNRAQFDDAVVALHGQFDQWDGRSGCAPLVTDAALVRPLWDRLADRAAARGHSRPDPVVTHDPSLCLEADGMPIEPTDAADGLIRFLLPPGCRQVRLRSNSDRPSTLSPWCDDRRRLGVALSAITLRQGRWRQDLLLDHLSPEAGWWPTESAGTLSWRWSNGDAVIALPEPGDVLDIALHAVMPVAVTDPADWQAPACGGIDR